MHRKKHKFINREISWLSFNDRVLQEAEDPSVPLIERIRFLGIFSNNLDEFYKVRVASLDRVLRFSVNNHDQYEFDPKQTISEIHKVVSKQNQKFDRVFDKLVSELSKNDIRLINENKLTPEQTTFIAEYFDNEIRPKLIPIRLDSKSKFPELKDSTIYLAVELGFKRDVHASSYALLEIPTGISRFVVLPGEGEKKYVMFVDDIIRCHLSKIFGILKFDYAKAYTIKIVRDAELDMDDDLSKSMVDKMTRSLSQRKRGKYVRLNYDPQMPPHFLEFILKKTKIKDPESIIEGGRYHNKRDLMSFPDFGRKDLCYKKLPVIPHPDLTGKTGVLDQVMKKDILLFFPYHSFSHVVDMLRESAIDPNVSTIRICLYRVAKDSQVVNALIAAARNGKKVIAVIEIQARFDEENNIVVTRQLQEAGVRVIPGVNGLKVHSKIILISRKEKNKLQRYALIGSGNMHERTSSVYSDIALLTRHGEITNELRKLFEFFETNYHRSTFRHLLVSPFNVRRKLNDLISKEIENAEKGKPAWIRLKLNNLVDPQMIRKLYEAGDAGVKIELSVRGTCCLIGESPGLSKNIIVRSIVGRYLEHARVMAFCNNDKPLYFISSADWMTRNLDYRIEVTAPVYDPVLTRQLQMFLDFQFAPDTKARIVDRRHSNSYVDTAEGKELKDPHVALSALIAKLQK